MAKAAMNKIKTLFYQRIRLKIYETSKMLYLERSFDLCWNLDTSGSA